MDSHPASLGRVSGVHVDGRDLPAPRAGPSAIAADGGNHGPDLQETFMDPRRHATGVAGTSGVAQSGPRTGSSDR